MAWTAALVIAVESLYAWRFSADAGGAWRVGALAFDLRSSSTLAWLVALIGIGAASRYVIAACSAAQGKAKAEADEGKGR